MLGSVWLLFLSRGGLRKLGVTVTRMRGDYISYLPRLTVSLSAGVM